MATVRKMLFVACAVAALMPAHAALAQSSEGGDILIIAQKREQNLQDVPIAVTAQSAQDLARAGIAGTQDLGAIVPNLTVTREGNAQTTFLRGIGNPSATIGQEPSVAYYVDGVYNPNPTSGTLSFNNIERIEVLKGPQGTLFGRNTTGGVIQIVTRDPSFQTSGEVAFGFGNYETVQSRVYVSTGLTDDLAADIAMRNEYQSKGFGRNVTVGRDRAGAGDLSVRSKWLWTPSPDTAIRVVGEYARMTGGLGLDRDLAPGAFGLGGIGATPGFQDISMFVYGDSKTEVGSGHIDIRHKFGDVDFKSITSYRNDDIYFQYASNGTSLPAVGVFANAGQDTVTQEFNLSGSTAGFSWLAGLYYYDTKAQFEPIRLTSSIGAFGAVDEIQAFSRQDTTSIAAFGEVNIALTPATNLTLGGRWSRDKLVLTGETRFLVGGAVVSRTPRYEDMAGFQNRKIFKELTWRAILDHHFSDDVMAYGSYSHGYKSGVFNLAITSAPSPIVNPEKIDAFEVGLKTELLGGAVRINAAAFYYDFKDLQLPIVVVGGLITRNASAARVKGGEVELFANLGGGLSVQSSLALLDSEYRNFLDGPIFIPRPASSGGNITGSDDLSGNSLQKAPPFTFSLRVSHDMPLGNGKLRSSLAWSYNDGFFWDAENRLKEKAYHLLNGRIAWRDDNSGLEVGIWARNLTNTHYTIYGFTSSSGDLLAPAAPRTYGATIGWTF